MITISNKENVHHWNWLRSLNEDIVKRVLRLNQSLQTNVPNPWKALSISRKLWFYSIKSLDSKVINKLWTASLNLLFSNDNHFWMEIFPISSIFPNIQISLKCRLQRPLKNQSQLIGSVAKLISHRGWTFIILSHLKSTRWNQTHRLILVWFLSEITHLVI